MRATGKPFSTLSNSQRFAARLAASATEAHGPSPLSLAPSQQAAGRGGGGRALVAPCDKPHFGVCASHAEGRLRDVPVPLAIGALALRRSTAAAPTSSGS